MGCVDETVLEEKRRAAGDLPDTRAIAAATIRDREVVAAGRLVAKNSCSVQDCSCLLAVSPMRSLRNAMAAYVCVCAYAAVYGTQRGGTTLLLCCACKAPIRECGEMAA